MKRLVEARFEQKKYDKHCTGKEYPTFDETRQTEIHARIFQKSLIIADRFPVYVITSTCANHTLWQIENVNDHIGFRNGAF